MFYGPQICQKCVGGWGSVPVPGNSRCSPDPLVGWGVGEGDTPSPIHTPSRRQSLGVCAPNHPGYKRPCRSTSAVTPSKKVLLTRIGSPLRGFQFHSIRSVRCPQRVLTKRSVQNSIALQADYVTKVVEGKTMLQNIVSQLHLAKTEPRSIRTVSLRQLFLLSFFVLDLNDL